MGSIQNLLVFFTCGKENVPRPLFVASGWISPLTLFARPDGSVFHEQKRKKCDARD